MYINKGYMVCRDLCKSLTGEAATTPSPECNMFLTLINTDILKNM